MSVWRGVPLHKAIIVRHTPRDHDKPLGRKGTGAIPIEQAGKALDYAGRYGEHAGKGDIDRDPTRHDNELRSTADSAQPSFDAADRLDYALREGAYEGKSRDGLDASLWDQHGPVSREEAQARMEAAGGAFVDSFIAIGREYTRTLGIETKEDIQRLVRTTWNEAVEKWGVIKNPEDIRYVAAVHFDANRSIHAHIYTWSARGEIEPGWTVGREATRAGKEIVYKAGYSKIVSERDERSNYLRDLARYEAVRQCGRRVEDRDLCRLSSKAARLGYPERLSSAPDVDPSRAKALERLQSHLSSSLEKGYGRLSDNWRANAIARDVVRELRSSSPSFKRVWDEYERCVQAKADIKGYSAKGFAQERDEFVRAEMGDFMKRIANGVRNGHLPESRHRPSGRLGRDAVDHMRKEDAEERRIRARARREREERKAAEAQARLSARSVLAQHEAARSLGASLDKVGSMGRDMANLSRAVEYGGYRSYDEAPAHVRRMADDWAEKLASTQRAQSCIERAASDLCAKDATRDPFEAKESVAAAIRDVYARRLFADAREGAFGRPPELAPDARQESLSPASSVFHLGSMVESVVAAASNAMASASRKSAPRRPDREAERQRFDDEERKR